MKKNFTTLLMIFLFLTVGVASRAQNVSTERFAKLPPKERAQKLTDVMNKRLLLSPEQANSVYNINLKYAELNEQSKRDFAKIKENNDARNEELKAVLTPEQFTKLLKMEDKVKERVKEKMEERRAEKGA